MLEPLPVYVFPHKQSCHHSKPEAMPELTHEHSPCLAQQQLYALTKPAAKPLHVSAGSLGQLGQRLGTEGACTSQALLLAPGRCWPLHAA